MNGNPISKDGCNYLEEKKLPVLVLATKERYDFIEPEKFIAIAHQTAGIACHQHYMMGRVLAPKPELTGRIREITDCWLESNSGAFGVSMNELLEYRKQLNEWLGVDCNSSYKDFEEAIYPIDCSPENVRKLALDEVPDNLDDLISWKNEAERFIGFINRWNIYILGLNSD